ncbi:DNA polymerase IV [Cellulomonas bogoriensis]|uniref:DNA polymerase IV n=1 Tax=Cellulomonas bogoriensis 69B4 = DSM 16987 TaxID=1386082 RepID=A0A0A0BX56_9CELL|nr:DNA polymerase IV [Cellulomonas bogoriensis]KGM12998.1 DNA polymerase IV [Cellulomonas bogoriensis 69B4 = DSM 16987]
MPVSGATILHADLDAFYASVEQLLDPALRGRPIAVGGRPTGGVVLAASYEAKAFGVQGGMPGWRAARLCPELTFVRGSFREYQRLGDAVMTVLADVTPLVERVSIDEAFLDVAGSTHLFGAPEHIARTIRARVREEIGLPISVGAARTKHLAKIASQVAKPDGLVVVTPGTEREFLDPLPVGLIWGVGPVHQARLASHGITTIGQLTATPSSTVERLVGHAVGHKLLAMAHDEDTRRVVTARRSRSVGAQSALGRRSPEPELLRAVLSHLADRVSRRLRATGTAGRTITVRVRFAGMRSVTRARTLSQPVATTLTLTEVAEQLATGAIEEAGRPEITLLGMSVSKLDQQHALQLELELPPPDPWRPGSRTGASRRAVDGQMDAIRERFGTDAVGYLPALMRRGQTVPDEFRELAERELDTGPTTRAGDDQPSERRA